MSNSEYEKLDKRLKALEEKVSVSVVTPKKEKKPRKSSPYNEFMKEFITEQKSKGSNKAHKELFAEGAKAWNIKKSTN
jgi:hypothetical protein